MAYDAMTKPKESTLRAWVVVLVMLVCTTAAAAANNLLTPIMATMLEDLGLPTTYGATLSAIFVAMNAICSIPVGFLVQKFGIKTVGCVGLVVLVLGSVLGAVSGNAVVLIAARVIQGIGYTAPVVLSPIILAQWFPESKLSLPIGIAGAYAGLGSLVVLQSANIVMPVGGWHAVFWACTAFVAVSLILFVFGAKPGPYVAVKKEEKGDRADRPHFTNALKVPEIWMLILIYFGCGCSMKAFFPFSAMIYTDLCGVDAATANTLASVFSFGMIFAGAIGGAIVSAAGKKRGIAFALIIIIGMVAISWGFFINSPLQAWIFVVIAGFTVVAIPPLATAAVPDVIDDKRLIPIAMSLFLCLGQFVAGMVGPYVSAVAQQIGGTWNAAGVPVMVFAVLSSICAILIARKMLKKDRDRA